MDAGSGEQDAFLEEEKSELNLKEEVYLGRQIRMKRILHKHCWESPLPHPGLCLLVTYQTAFLDDLIKKVSLYPIALQSLPVL